jgi:PAS domain S-box-containing protein
MCPAKKQSRKQAEQESLVQLWYFEKMDQVNRAMQGKSDLEQLMREVLDTLLAVFDCDRAWLVYPCDPDCPTWQVPMERFRPEYPGVFPIGVELPLDPLGAEVYRILRETNGPVQFGPGGTHPVPAEMAAGFQVQSFIAMAFYPRVGKPWSFGLHQCSYARTWTGEEERLLQEIGRRFSDSLTSLLTYRNLQESEQQIKQLIDASPVAMVVSSGIDERVEWVNNKFIELFGYTIGDMPDVAHWWPLAYPDEVYREEIKARWQAGAERAIAEKKQTKPMEATVICKDGSRRYVEFRISSIGQKHLVTFVDLTEHKQMEDMLHEQEKHSQSLLRLSKSLERAQTYTQALEATRDEVRIIIGYQNLWVYLFTEDKNHAHFLISGGMISDLVMSVEGTVTLTVKGDRMLEEIADAKDIIVVEDAQTDERTNKEIVAKLKNRTIVNVPVFLFDKHLGSVGMGTFGDEGVRIPSGLEQEYLRSMASHLAAALDRIHLFTERKRAEDALRESEEKYRLLHENAGVGIGYYKPDGEVISYNQMAASHMKGKPEDFNGKSIYEIFPKREADFYMDRIKRSLTADSTLEYEDHLNLPLGEKWFLSTFVKICDLQGNVIGIQVISQDITERKRAEIEIQALAKFPGENPSPVMRIGHDGILSYANRASADLLRYWKCSVGEMLPESWQKLILETLNVGLPREEDITCEERVFALMFSPIVEGNYVNLYGRDITERKRSEAINASRLHLVEFSLTHSLDELLEETLNETERLTGSLIGFYHFVEDDQKSLTLQNWSTRTKTEFCQAEGKGLHYAVDEAGVWVDCVHQLKAVIHNDYASLPHRKGMPVGHAALLRELVVPVFRGRKISAILGVGNKPDNYTEKDAETVSLIAELAWEIVERKRAEEAEHRLNRELRAISNCNQTLMRAVDGQTLLDDICRIICDEAGYRMAWVGYAGHDDARTVRPVAWAGPDSGFIENVNLSWADNIESGSGPVGIAIRTGEIINVQNIATDPRMAPWRERLLQRGYRSSIALPLEGEDANVFGALLIYSGETNAFTPGEIRLLEELAGDLAFGITALQTRAERKRAEEDLRESEERFRSFVEKANDIVYTISPDGIFTYVSPNWKEILGHEISEVEGRSFEAFIHPDDLLACRAVLKQILSSGEKLSGFEYRVQHKNGSWKWHTSNASVIRNIGGKVTSFLGIARDITERKQMEQELVAREREYRVLLENIPDPIVRYDTELRRIYVNPAWERASGLSAREVVNEYPKDIPGVPEPVNKEYLDKLEQTLNTGVAQAVEFAWVNAHGATLFLEYIIVPEFDQHRKLSGVLSVGRDITERKRHEREREAIIAVSTALRQASNRGEILNAILDQLVDLFDADGAVLVLPDPQTGGFVDEMGRGFVGERMIGLSIPSGKGVCNWVIQNRRPYMSNHADQDDLFYRPDLLGDSHCIASVPLITQALVIGAFWIARQTEINEQDLRLLNAIADIAANAIHRVILNEQTDQQLHHLLALHQIDVAISTNFDLNITLNIILTNVKNELDVDAVSVLLLNPVTHTLDYATGLGFRTRGIEKSHVLVGDGCAGRAAQEYRTVSCKDLSEAHGIFSRSTLLAGEAFKLHYATPLVVHGQIKGVLEVFHRKPFDPDAEWLNYFETLATQTAIGIESAALLENLQRSNAELMLAYDATIEGWSRALDLRDKETEGHTQRVADMALKLAERMGMSDAEKQDLWRGALLHDIGKMGVPDAILLKPGSLTEAEWVVMRRHPVYAYNMLAPIAYLRHAMDISYCHHEKWDGSGYPRGLKGEEIPLAARVFAVADVFDALTSDRPYRKAWPLEEVYQYIEDQSGKQFDPQVVRAFLESRLVE